MSEMKNIKVPKTGP